jgi:hypothetical protein
MSADGLSAIPLESMTAAQVATSIKASLGAAYNKDADLVLLHAVSGAVLAGFNDDNEMKEAFADIGINTRMHQAVLCNYIQGLKTTSQREGGKNGNGNGGRGRPDTPVGAGRRGRHGIGTVIALSYHVIIGGYHSIEHRQCISALHHSFVHSCT